MMSALDVWQSWPEYNSEDCGGEGRREVIYHSSVQCKSGTKESKLKQHKFLVAVFSVFMSEARNGCRDPVN